MHYKDGTPAKLGDIVKSVESYEVGNGEAKTKVTVTKVGILAEATPGSTSCNGSLKDAIERRDMGDIGSHTRPHGHATVTLGQCEKVA